MPVEPDRTTSAPPAAPAHDPTDRDQGWDAVSHWYQAFFTGMVLSVSSRCGASAAAEWIYRVFCDQRERRFIAGLRKLGIDHLPPAVAAAQYHYLSNNIGGVSVQYMPESDRKAWVRYCPPRWAWAGTALCGIPPEVSIAMLAGWHARNGLSLGNDRLGFVCTKQTVDGQSALEGYYYEYDAPISDEQRLRFAREEDGPDFDPTRAPVLASSEWPAARLAKARRNYAIEYVRTALPIAVNQFGPMRAESVLRLCARQIGMQFYHQTAAELGILSDGSAAAFAAFMAAIGAAQDDQLHIDMSGDSVRIRQSGWNLFHETDSPQPQIATIWNGLYEGALAAHNRRLVLEMRAHECTRPVGFEWTIRPVARAPF